MIVSQHTEPLWWTQPDKRFDPKDKVCLMATSSEMEAHGWVQVGVAEIIWRVDDQIDPTEAQVAAIEKQMESIQANAERELNTLRAMKANLLALPAPASKPTEPDDDLPF